MTFIFIFIYAQLFLSLFLVSCRYFPAIIIGRMEADLLHPSIEDEKRMHKLKRLIPSPNSYFMDIKCPGCYSITTAFSHAQSVITCEGCNTVLCTPTGGKCKVTVGCSFRKKID